MQLGKVILFALVLGSSCAWADSTAVVAPAGPAASSSESSSHFIDDIKQKKFDEDARINDLQIRADAGSLSRYSAKFIIDYAGPSLDDLSAPTLPNPDNHNADLRSYVSGIIGMKYRLTSNDGIYVSAGLKGYIRQKAGDHQDLTDPGVSYDHTYIFSKAVQAHTTVGANLVTNSYYHNKLGETAGTFISQMVKWNVNQSRWIVGGSVSFNSYYFNRGYNAQTDTNATDYYFNVIPSVEYKLTPSLNLNTSILKKIGHYRKSTDTTTFDADSMMWSGRIGVGWAVLHDVYLNPYIGYYPEAMSWKYASIGFSGVVSAF